jgi:SAM-dependent methyltransferase
MKSLSKNLLVLILFPVLILRRIYFWNRVDKSKLPGAQFAEFGFNLGKKLLYKFKLSPRLILNPVSIVRYFEYDFVNSSLNFQNGNKILDVSSPYLFGFYVSNKYQLEYHYINPDERDLANVNSLSAKMNFKGKYFPKPMDALNLSFPDNYFDKIISISVIEHIKDDGDSNAVKEIWRTLKTGGLFGFTVPVKRIFEIEYRNKDEYNPDKKDKANKYFFQRIYDKQKIEERLLSSISNYEIIQKKIFGAKEKEFYPGYKARWMKFNYWETVKDPYYIANKFSNFNDIDDLEDIGVIGITIRKLK